MQTHTLVDPDAMVVKFLNAYVAHTAVFGPCWLLYIAGAAFLFVCEDYSIAFVASQSFVNSVRGYSSRVDIASQEISCIAQEHNYRSSYFMDLTHVFSR